MILAFVIILLLILIYHLIDERRQYDRLARWLEKVNEAIEHLQE